MSNLRIHLLHRIHHHLPMLLQLLLRLGRPPRPFPIQTQPRRLPILRRELHIHRLGPRGGRPAHIVGEVISHVDPDPFDVLSVLAACRILFDFFGEVAHFFPLLDGESVDPAESVRLVHGAEFLELFHLLDFVEIVFPAYREVEEGHEAEDHEHGVGASVGDGADDDIGMILLDLFDGGYGLGEEMTFGGVMAFHFPRVVDGLDDAGVDGCSCPFLGRFTNRSSQITHIRRPILGSLFQFRLQNELFHLFSNGRHADFLVIHRRRLQRIGARASVNVLGLGDLGANFFARFDNVAGLNVHVAKVGHGRGEGVVGLVEYGGDGVESIIEVECNEA
mmetsp:Transcript_11213/g.23906  ORF Transcript_11213/g.23906 Transcript_11213/m.23906 type:complete len:334 (-) Transcript_11213:352-1353(-)